MARILKIGVGLLVVVFLMILGSGGSSQWDSDTKRELVSLGEDLVRAEFEDGADVRFRQTRLVAVTFPKDSTDRSFPVFCGKAGTDGNYHRFAVLLEIPVLEDLMPEERLQELSTEEYGIAYQMYQDMAGADGVHFEGDEDFDNRWMASCG